MRHNWLTNLLGMHPLALLALVLAGMLLVIVLHGLLYRSRFLAICPKVKDEGDELIACTSLAGWLLSLTLIFRRVDVDAQRKVVVINRRLFWFFKSAKVIPFGQIQEINYEYEDLGPFTSLGLTGDSKDCFSVNLRLVDDSTVHLFNFLGEGDFEPGLMNPLFSLRWYLAKMFLAFCGSQEETSRQFVDRLEKLIGVKVSE
ncbi:MAG: hypothetical protein ABSG67_12990 [Thermoguttaceae bacterium]|jgi:hypothetical protein